MYPPRDSGAVRESAREQKSSSPLPRHRPVPAGLRRPRGFRALPTILTRLPGPHASASSGRGAPTEGERKRPRDMYGIGWRPEADWTRRRGERGGFRRETFSRGPADVTADRRVLRRSQPPHKAKSSADESSEARSTGDGFVALSMVRKPLARRSPTGAGHAVGILRIAATCAAAMRVAQQPLRHETAGRTCAIGATWR